MSSTSSIQAAILKFFDARTTLGDLEPDTDLTESGAIDSLTVMEFVLHAQEVFRVRLEGPDVSPRTFRSIQTLTSLIASKVQLGTC